MRTMLLSFLLCVGAAASGAAQNPAPAPSPSTSQNETGLADGLLPEPQIMSRAIDRVGPLGGDTDSEAKDGFYPEIGGLLTGAGWIAGGPGYRKHFFDGQALVQGSALISWRAYKEAQARFELPKLAGGHLTLGVQGRWQDFTQIEYFGIGADSLESLRSEYRLKDTDVLGYGVVRANRWLSIGGRFGWLRHPTLRHSAGPFDRDLPNTLEVFAQDPGVAQQPNFLHGDVSVTVDTTRSPRPSHERRSVSRRGGYLFRSRSGSVQLSAI
jgi:hypothetical protein